MVDVDRKRQAAEAPRDIERTGFRALVTACNARFVRFDVLVDQRGIDEVRG